MSFGGCAIAGPMGDHLPPGGMSFWTLVPWNGSVTEVAQSFKLQRLLMISTPPPVASTPSWAARWWRGHLDKLLPDRGSWYNSPNFRLWSNLLEIWEQFGCNMIVWAAMFEVFGQQCLR
jgi:hypothetical protein